MWILVAIVFAICAIICNRDIYWVVFGMLVVAHNIEYLAIQLKKLLDEKKKEQTEN